MLYKGVNCFCFRDKEEKKEAVYCYATVKAQIVTNLFRATISKEKISRQEWPQSRSPIKKRHRAARLWPSFHRLKM